MIPGLGGGGASLQNTETQNISTGPQTTKGGKADGGYRGAQTIVFAGRGAKQDTSLSAGGGSDLLQWVLLGLGGLGVVWMLRKK